MVETMIDSTLDLLPVVTALLLSAVMTVPPTALDVAVSLLRTNQKFYHKFSVFECMKIAQNYAQVYGLGILTFQLCLTPHYLLFVSLFFFFCDRVLRMRIHCAHARALFTNL